MDGTVPHHTPSRAHHERSDSLSTLVADPSGDLASDGDAKQEKDGEMEQEASLSRSSPDESSSETDYKTILRKIDLKILPFTLILYFMSHLDKYNLGQAHARDLDHDLGLHDNQFANILSVYYPAYLVLHYLVGAFAQHLRTRFFVPSVVVLCGLATLLSGLANSFLAMLLSRFALGILEGAAAPCIVLLYANWYPSERLATRINLLRMGMPVAGMASALICAGFYTYVQSKSAWRPMFVSEGLVTVLLAVPGFWLVPNFIEHYRPRFPTGRSDSGKSQSRPWVQSIIAAVAMSEEQRSAWSKFLVRQAGPLRRKTPFTWAQLLRSFYEPKLCLFYVIAIANQVTHSNMINFAPVVIRSLGYRGSMINVMAAGPLAFAVVVMMATAALSDRLAVRGLPLLVCSFLTMVGQALLLANVNAGCSYASLYLVVAFSYPCNGLLIAWCSSNVGPGYTRNSAITIISVASSAISLLSANIFPPSDAPRFFKGHIIGFVSIVIATLSCATLLALIVLENRRRESRFPLKGIPPAVLHAAMQYDLCEAVDEHDAAATRESDPGKGSCMTDKEARAFWHLDNLTDVQFARLGERHPGVRLHL